MKIQKKKKKEQHETPGLRVADCSQTIKLQWEMYSYFFFKKEEEEEEEREKQTVRPQRV